MKPGTLIVLEGLDGSGKSTQLLRLAEALRVRGVDPLLTHEPWDGHWGRRIRAMARSGRPLAPEEELRWFVEDRREHVRELVRPALAAGRVVLCDRYTLSTVAYQGARGLDPVALLAAGEAEFPLPDLVILLEIEPAAGLGRLQGRAAPEEPVFEKRAFLERAAAVFRRLECDYLERVDASGSADEVHAAILAALERRDLL